MTMDINFEFRRAAQVLPKKSGYYLCLTGKNIQCLHYSSRWNRFNVYDHQDDTAYQIKVIWWAPLPAPLRNYL